MKAPAALPPCCRVVAVRGVANLAACTPCVSMAYLCSTSLSYECCDTLACQVLNKPTDSWKLWAPGCREGSTKEGKHASIV